MTAARVIESCAAGLVLVWAAWVLRRSILCCKPGPEPFQPPPPKPPPDDVADWPDPLGRRTRQSE